MTPNGKKWVLIAEDDDDHFILIQEAIELAKWNCPIDRVKDGMELMDYLEGKGSFAKHQGHTLPALILLDLNMPKKNGREVLSELKDDPRFKAIPLIALSTSLSQEDVTRSYDMGLNSFFRKPTHFKDWVELMKLIKDYWLETALLPLSSRP